MSFVRKNKLEKDKNPEPKKVKPGAGVEPRSEDAKAKSEKDYASHPKFAKFKREGQ